MDWKLKARVFRALSRLPLGAALHYQLQRRITKEWPRRPEVLGQLLTAARRLHAVADGRQEQALEIGAGRDLAVAVALRMLGVRHITCVDVERLARPELVAHAAAYMARELGVPAPWIRSMADIEAFGITYVAPTTLQAAGLAPATFDCFYSVDTLEHIPTEALREVFRCAHALLTPAGLSLHLIDYGDHYARSDNGLSRFNFLTFTEEGWEPYNSRFQYVNRLRHSDFLGLFEESGLHVEHAEPDVEPVQPQILENLAPQFRGRELEDLFTVRALVVAKRKGEPTS